MSYVVVIFKTDGTITSTSQARIPKLDQLQEAVGGFIETVPSFHRYGDHRRGTAYCNEMGGVHKLPFNSKATQAWLDNLGKGPFRYEPLLFGNVIYYAKEK